MDHSRSGSPQSDALESRMAATRAALSERIREARDRANLSQRALGTRVGCTGAAVAAWERGLAVPRAQLLPELARVLGVSVDYLTGWDAA